MKDDQKTKKQLIEELNGLRQSVAELKGFEEEIVQTRVDSEKFTKAFLQNSIPAGITTLKEGRFIEVSDAYLGLMGRKRDEVIGHTSVEIGFTTEDQRSTFFNELNNKGRVENLEMKVRTKGGVLRDGLFNSVIMSLGNEKYLLTVMTDITDRKRAEEALRESEEKLSAMFQSIPDHMSVMDNELNIVWANETATRMFGNDIIGRKCYEAYHRRKEPCEPYPCLTLKAFKDGGVHEHDIDVIDKAGKQIHFHCTANVASKDKDGKPITVLEISRDITERKRAEEALRISEERFRILSEAAFEAIAIHEDGVLIHANDQCYKMFGYEPGEALGKEMMSVTTAPEVLEAMIKHITADSLGPYEATGVRKDGTRFSMEIRARKMAYKGRIARVAAIRDITERKQAEEELRKYRDNLEALVDERTKELEEKNLTLNELNVALKVLLRQGSSDKKKLEDRFVSNIQTIILPSLEKIKAGASDGQRRIWLGIIEKNLTEIMSPLLTTVRQLNFTRQEIQVATLIREGKTTKEIAELLGAATKTVDTHRSHIRKKLGINNNKINLYTHIQSIS